MRIIAFILILFVCRISFAIEIPENSTDLKAVSKEAIEGCTTDEEKIRAMRDYVFKRMQPYGNGYTLEQIQSQGWTLKEMWQNGVGWCDHQSQVFMFLAKENGFTTRMIYLLKKDMHTSPHTIVEAKLDERWVVVDVGNNVDFITKDGRMATREDMNEDFSILEKAFEGNAEYGGNKERMEYFLNNAYLVRILEP